MKSQIKQSIQKVLAKLYPDHQDIEFDVSYAPENIDADYASNIALVLAKKVGEDPMAVVEELVNRLQATSYKLQAQEPGFLNFKLSPEQLLGGLKEIVEQKDSYGAPAEKSDQKVLIEYFQPNIAKPLHVGHMRSAIIGDSLYRLHQLFYQKVQSDTHMGDWGTQFGMLLYAYKNLEGEKKVKDNPVEELNQLYVQLNQQIEQDPALKDKAKREFVKLEQGDEENRKLWRQFVKWSMEEHLKINDLLDIKAFDYHWPESFYEDKMPAVIKTLEGKNLLDDLKGAKVVNLEKYKLGMAIIIKSDSGTTYLLRDLATYLFRKNEKGFNRQLYVVDTRQSHHFRQLFKILELLGEYQPEEGTHVEFGFMSLPEGTMSSRKGNVVVLDEFINEAEKRALKIIEEKNPDLKDKEEAARQAAIGAVKYADLKNNRKSDIVFNWDEAFNFEGNSGPYLMYTHARLKSILRKAADSHGLKERILTDISGNPSVNQWESVLLRQLLIYPDVLADTVRELLPSVLANYLYELAGKANSFYHEVPVLGAETEEETQARLALVQASAQVLKNGLSLLGIKAPEEM